MDMCSFFVRGWEKGRRCLSRCPGGSVFVKNRGMGVSEEEISYKKAMPPQNALSHSLSILRGEA